MKQLFSLLFVVVVAVVFGLAATVNSRQVTILYWNYRTDLSLNLLIVLVIVSFLLFYGLVRGVSGAIRLPERVKAFKASRRREGAHRALRESVLALTEGRYSKVERLAHEAAVEQADGEPAALLAALAAQRLREFERRDKWLEPLLAGEGPPAHAALLVRAESLVEQKDFEHALEVISPLLKNSRKNVRALQLAMHIYEGAGRWVDMLRIVRLLANRGALHPATVESLTLAAYDNLITQHAGDAYALTALWRQALPKEMGQTTVVIAMARALAKAGVSWQAKSMVEQALAVRWDAELVACYADVCLGHPVSGLEMAERWLEDHENDSALLETLGKLCVAQQMWAKALLYFERLFHLRPAACIAAQLAMLNEKKGDADRERFYAAQCINLTLNPRP